MTRWDEIMEKKAELTALLGSGYSYRRYLPTIEFLKLMHRLPPGENCVTAASLTAGCLRIQAVIYRKNGQIRLGYDVYIRESMDSLDWICYDSPDDEADISEQNMLSVLDRTARENDLSYTEGSFERLVEKTIKETGKR